MARTIHVSIERADEGDNDRANQPDRRIDEEANDDAADERADQTDDEVGDEIPAARSGNHMRKPTGDQADDNPADQYRDRS